MKVKFIPQNIELEIEPNQTVLDLAQKNGIFIKSVCNGLPSCAECRVRVVEGEHNVMPPFSKEINLIGTGHYIDQRRLACQMQCFGNITIDLSEQIEKQASGPRRPQGSKKTTDEKSFAITGNLIEQEHDFLEESASVDFVEGDSAKKKEASVKPRKGHQNRDENHKKSKDSHLKKNHKKGQHRRRFNKRKNKNTDA